MAHVSPTRATNLDRQAAERNTINMVFSSSRPFPAQSGHFVALPRGSSMLLHIRRNGRSQSLFFSIVFISTMPVAMACRTKPAVS